MDTTPDQRRANSAMLEPEALSEALIRQGTLSATDRVVSVHAEEIVHGNMADSYLLKLQYASARNPTSLFAKLPPSDIDSARLDAMIGAHARECWFYSEIAPSLGIRTPHLYGLVGQSNALQGLLLQDLSGARSIDQIQGTDPGTVGAALTELATLHASCWNDPDLAASSRPFDRLGRVAELQVRFRDSWRSHGIAVSAAMAPDQRTLIERFADSCPEWASDIPGPSTLIHQDIRLDNLMFTSDGPSILDWQLTGWGPAMADVAYLVATSLPIDVRRESETVLVRRYLSDLADQGVTEWDFDTAWQEYRRLSLYTVLALVPPLAHVRQSERGVRMFAAMLERGTRQALDLGAVDFLP